MTAAVVRLGGEWFAINKFVEHTLSFSHDALHVIMEVALQLLLAGLLRTSVGSWWTWLSVLARELINEAGDLRVEIWHDLAMQRGEGAKDLLLTMVLPTLLLATARVRPQMLAGVASDTGGSTTRAGNASIPMDDALQKFAAVHASFRNHFSQERHLLGRETYTLCRSS